MPASAIASGCVDIILEPALMPQAIEDIVRSKAALFPVDDNEEKEVEEIKAIIKEQLPFDFSDYKQATLLRRIKRRAAHYDLSTLESYISVLKTDAEEVKVLAQDFLISVTSFFRDKEAFEIIAKKVIPVTVSYTHLDVYKRQIKCLLGQRQNLSNLFSWSFLRSSINKS